MLFKNVRSIVYCSTLKLYIKLTNRKYCIKKEVYFGQKFVKQTSCVFNFSPVFLCFS